MRVCGPCTAGFGNTRDSPDLFNLVGWFIKTDLIVKDGKHVAESAICHPSEGEVGQGSVTRREQWLSGLRSHLLFY